VLVAATILPLWVTRIIIGTLLCVFGAYLSYAHDPTWTLYYLEMQAPLAFLTAIGFYGIALRLSDMAGRRWPQVAGRRADICRLIFFAALIWLAVPTIERIASYRRAHAEQRVYRERFERALAALPAIASIVIVKYAPGHGEERLVDNVPDLWSAKVWIVHDRGAENARLRALAPNRVPYLYRELRRGDSIEFRIDPFIAAQPGTAHADQPGLGRRD